jgi:hypothetical protein
VTLNETGATIRVVLPPDAAYRCAWRKQGQNLFNIPGLFRGVTTTTLELLSDDPSLLGSYDVVISNDCGTTTSNPVRVIDGSGIGACTGDHNRDGSVDGGDLDAFLADWRQGRMAADVNQDGGVDGEDVQTFFVAWHEGC